MCTLCANKVLKYKDCGVACCTDDATRKGKISNLLDAQNNSLLPGVSDPVETNRMYGAPAFHNVLKSSSILQPSVHMRDWKVNMEAIVVANLAEKGFPFTMTGRSILGCCFILVF